MEETLLLIPDKTRSARIDRQGRMKEKVFDDAEKRESIGRENKKSRSMNQEEKTHLQITSCVSFQGIRLFNSILLKDEHPSKQK